MSSTVYQPVSVTDNSIQRNGCSMGMDTTCPNHPNLTTFSDFSKESLVTQSLTSDLLSKSSHHIPRPLNAPVWLGMDISSSESATRAERLPKCLQMRLLGGFCALASRGGFPQKCEGEGECPIASKGDWSVKIRIIPDCKPIMSGVRTHDCGEGVHWTLRISSSRKRAYELDHQ